MSYTVLISKLFWLSIGQPIKVLRKNWLDVGCICLYIFVSNFFISMSEKHSPRQSPEAISLHPNGCQCFISPWNMSYWTQDPKICIQSEYYFAMKKRIGKVQLLNNFEEEMTFPIPAIYICIYIYMYICISGCRKHFYDDTSWLPGWE